ncbi:ubiquitin-protein ligase E3C isoform X2 [Danaus plexippus]|uniref:ubiquitin-protein ligase E3C isoform X2 n=1 Tax=Danaus plexippus TaxID=13037 RepID=UPI002AB036ED|nr:ubiquitin-protein ligase E3C isoform X2 [Danaus plexippus]
MYSFEGDFRRKPQQNLAGASGQRKTDRNTLILQTQQQRQKREEHRKRLHSTIKIQAYVRSYLTRKHFKQSERDEFDIIFPKANTEDLVLISSLLTKILFFYDVKKDCSRLVAISQLLLKQWKRLFELGDCSVQIRRLLALHLHFLRNDTEVPLAVPLRMFEVFTSVNSLKEFKNHDECLSINAKTFLYLVKRGYFKDLCILLCQKTPPLYGPSPNPPTPLCGALLDLIQRPLQLTTHLKDSEYDDIIMTEFIAAYLCNHYPEPVDMYILPALIHDRKFPFLPLLQCLNDEKFSAGRIVNDSWLLHSILILEPIDFVKHLREIDNARLSNNKIVLAYMKILAKLTVNVCNKQITYEYEDSLYSHEAAADNDDSSDSENEPNPTSVREQMLLTKSIEILNEPDKCVMMTCAQIQESDLSDEFLDYMSTICHNLLLSHRMALHKYRLLYTLAFKPIFLRGLWQWLSSMSHESSFGGSPTPLLSALSRGMGAETSVIGVHRLLSPLAVFCELFSLLIGTLHDTEFFTDTDGDEKMSISSTSSGAGRVHAFDFSELGGLCRTLKQVCLGLVELAYPESRPAVVGQYKDAVGGHHDVEDRNETPAWAHLFKVCTQLLRSLYARDARLQFVGGTSVGSVGGAGGVGGAWVAAGSAPGETEAALAAVRAPRSARPYRAYVPRLARAEQDEGPPLTIKELRTVTILREIPFVVPFSTRVLIFQGLLLREKHDHWYEMTNFNEGPSIIISVRRTHLYEDAFDKLSQEPNLKLKLRVQLINQAGAEEPGVDGGGLFREFLSELLRSSFDPNRGLFRLTKDNMLYPNPGVHLLYDDFPMHYYFVGRMLGKALYENLLVELPLAEFFLAKLCSTREPDVHALASLDPGLYRGLLMLKAHREDVSDLGLDFTIISDELGEQRINELKPGGGNIPVTAENRIEYIHLVADYKLNRQIRSQCIAFKRGLTSVVNAEWLRMFSCRELQLLISGAEVPIDLVDLRRHTQYGGGFSDSHPTVQCFWKVLEGFTDHQRRQLLKFVTSCSRPPLLGFKDLQPPFCIQSAGGSERLPSSSTCMNLLKIPEYHSQDVLADKLLYAIQAEAGFELS